MPGFQGWWKYTDDCIDMAKASASAGICKDKAMPEENTQIYSSIDQRRQNYAWMRMEIQIYQVQTELYLVDFKCSGYERDDGTMLEEKDVMSPFPFLDMAAELIMQLASD